MQDFHILEPNEEPKIIKRKNKPRIIPNLESVAEMDTDIILEHIAEAEKEIIKESKVRECKPKSPKPVKIIKPEPEQTKVIFIKGPIYVYFED